MSIKSYHKLINKHYKSLINVRFVFKNLNKKNSNNILNKNFKNK